MWLRLQPHADAISYGNCVFSSNIYESLATVVLTYFLPDFALPLFSKDQWEAGSQVQVFKKCPLSAI